MRRGPVRLIRSMRHSIARHRRLLGLSRDGTTLTVVGDSHTGIFRSTPQVRAVHIGAITAYRAGEPGEVERRVVRVVFHRLLVRWAPVLIRLVFRPDDDVLLVCGEIDVRVHFAGRSAEYGSDVELARSLAQRLASVGRELSTKTGARVGILGVIPPVVPGDDPMFPVRGTSAQRVHWTKLLNSELLEASRRFELHYVDTYSLYAGHDGLLPEELSDDTVHIRPDQVGPLEARLRSDGVL